MALFMRLSGGKLCSHLKSVDRNGILLASRTVTLKPLPAKPEGIHDYDEDNMKLGRPQSPHLSIYAIQLTSTLSITHRFTGAALASYVTAAGFSAVVLPQPLSHYVEALNAVDVPSPVLSTAKFLLAFPFCYHICNGVRHLLWDSGRFLTLKDVYTTGYVMLIATVISAAGVLAL